MKKILTKLKEYKIYIIVLIASAIIFNIKLPYYVMAPGDIIPIDNRIETTSKKESTGNINLLYVTEYEGTVSSVVMSFLMKNWDLEKLEEVQLSNETPEEIKLRNKVMLDNSIQNAIFVAYNKAGKQINITNKKNIIIGLTDNKDLKIGDEILSANNILLEDITTLKEIINKSNINDIIELKIKRNNQELTYQVPVIEKNNMKMLGIVMITNYEYELDPEINIKFKDSEGGSSGGAMMSLSIYNAITDEDITKGLKIGGTGTIDINGNVGEIDGVKYKIMGAIKNDLDIVFVPSANYEDAIKAKGKNKIKIVSVDTFDEIINYLKTN
mgnify:FL=1